MRNTIPILCASFAALGVQAADIAFTSKRESMAAGEEIEVEIFNATDVGEYHAGKTTTHLQFGIWSSVINYWMCSLTDFIPAENGKQKVVIPASMGPSGMLYQIGVWGCSNPVENTVIMRQSTIRPDFTGFAYFTGGKGQFSPAEALPEIRFFGLASDFADIPCENYACAQKCAEEQVPVDEAWTRGSKWMNCLEKCEGVKIDYDYVDEFGGPATVGAPASTVAVPGPLPTPTEDCGEEDRKTKCGKSCCKSTEYCSDLGKSLCALLPEDFESLRSKYGGTKPTGSPTPSGEGQASATLSGGAPPAETGVAVRRGVEWTILGAAAGVVGVGAGLV